MKEILNSKITLNRIKDLVLQGRESIVDKNQWYIFIFYEPDLVRLLSEEFVSNMLYLGNDFDIHLNCNKMYKDMKIHKNPQSFNTKGEAEKFIERSFYFNLALCHLYPVGVVNFKQEIVELIYTQEDVAFMWGMCGKASNPQFQCIPWDYMKDRKTPIITWEDE